MDDLLSTNPLFHVFFGVFAMADAVTGALLVALIVALLRHHKAASVGIGIGIAFAATAATNLTVSYFTVQNAQQYNEFNPGSELPTTGVMFVGAPIAMAVAAAALFGVLIRTAWTPGRSMSTKLLLASTYLLGISLAGTFANQMAMNMNSVAIGYWNIGVKVDAYTWGLDFVFLVAIAGMLVVKVAIHRRNITSRLSGVFHHRPASSLSHETSTGDDAILRRHLAATTA